MAPTTNNNLALNIVNWFIDRLFEFEYKRIEKMKINICEQISLHRGKLATCFYLSGKLHTPTQYVQQGYHRTPREKPTLPFQLTHLGIELEKDMAIAANDESKIRQILSKLVLPCQTLQDIRDALPECLVQMNHQLKDLTRTKDAAWVIANDKVAMQQYNKALSRIEYYASLHMFF